jgi:hypothetical protein
MQRNTTPVNVPFRDSFSSPEELTSSNIDSFDGKLSGVYIISPHPSLEIAGAITIESGNIKNGLQRFIASHNNQSMFFMYHKTVEAEVR